MEIELRHLKVLVTVSQAGSVTAAASSLGVSQPALSAQVQRIEKALGGAVFVRGREGIALTPLGELVVERSRDLLRGLETLLEDVVRRAGKKDTLRVGATTLRYFSTFLTLLSDAGLDHDLVPRVHQDSGVLTDGLLTGDCDVGVVGITKGYSPPCPSPLGEIVVVEHEPLLVAMGATHPAAGAREVDLRDLANDDWILPPGETAGTYTAFLDSFRALGVTPSSRLGRQNLSDYWEYVAAGHALSLALPGNAPPDGAVIRPIKGQPFTWQRVLRWHPDRVCEEVAHTCARAARTAYVDLLLETGGRQPWWEESPEHRPVIGVEPMATVQT